MKMASTVITVDDGIDLSPIFSYDRLKIWIDCPELPIATSLLGTHCGDIKTVLQQIQYQARWKLMLAIFQPSVDCLQLLKEALGRDIATLINYAEIACDISADSGKQAIEYQDQFLSAAHMQYQRQPVKHHQGTWYYGRRSESGKRRSHVLALYADKPSKLNNAHPLPNSPPCCHFEWRATGSAGVARTGIVSIEDLILFDHQHFWNEHVRFYALPKATALGRILAKVAGADPNVSGSALRKRAAQWKEANSIDGKFVMHNALRETPQLTQHFETVPFTAWLAALVATE